MRHAQIFRLLLNSKPAKQTAQWSKIDDYKTLAGANLCMHTFSSFPHAIPNHTIHSVSQSSRCEEFSLISSRRRNKTRESKSNGSGNNNNINNDRQCCINKSKFNDKQNISCHAYQITRFLYEPADDSPHSSALYKLYTCLSVSLEHDYWLSRKDKPYSYMWPST